MRVFSWMIGTLRCIVGHLELTIPAQLAAAETFSQKIGIAVDAIKKYHIVVVIVPQAVKPKVDIYTVQHFDTVVHVRM